MIKQKWLPVEGKGIEVELHRVAGAANQLRADVDGKAVGYVWLRSVGTVARVYSYRFADDAASRVRGSCRDREEAVSRLMFDLRAMGKV